MGECKLIRLILEAKFGDDASSEGLACETFKFGSHGSNKRHHPTSGNQVGEKVSKFRFPTFMTSGN